MDLKQLRAFVYVADLGSFTKAAAFLNVTQPALSRQIRLLEEELGTRLFQRTSQGITLSTDGALLFEQAESVIGSVESIKARFDRRAGRQNATGLVSVGIPAPAARFFRDSFFVNFERDCPGISLRIVEGFSGLIHEWLLSGSIELAVLYGASTGRNRMFATEPLVVEALYAIGTASDENRSRTSIELAELVKHPLILPHKPHIIRDLLDSSGATARTIVESDANSILLQLAAAGRGYTILPFAAVGTAVLAGQVTATPIVNPSLNWEVSLCYSNLRPLGEAARIVLDTIKNEVWQLIRSGAWESAMLPRG